MGKRPFEFTKKVRNEAFFRQHGQCAQCGYSLRELVEHGHHVIANQSGNIKNPEDAFLGTVHNCVILCDGCHDIVHEGGDFRSGAMAPPDYYKHTHGRDAKAHLDWYAMVLREYLRIYTPTEPRSPD
jgi:hypothetical protein